MSQRYAVGLYDMRPFKNVDDLTWADATTWKGITQGQARHQGTDGEEMRDGDLIKEGQERTRAVHDSGNNVLSHLDE